MALISPILDDRTYEQLREELVKRIPVYAPEWTNHNESDPGIALLELFAYLGESLLYRFNQIPDTTKIAFLRLLGVAPRPARPARALIVAGTDLAGGVPVPREAEAKAGSVSFATEADIQVWPLDLVAAGKTPAPVAATRADRDRREDAAHRLLLGAADPKTFYETTLAPTDPAQQDARPLDVATTIDRSLWIALLRKPTTEITQLAGRSAFIGLAFDGQVERPFDLQSLDAGEAAAYGSPELLADPPPMLWRLWNGPPTPGGAEAFTPLEVGSDTTRGLTSTGVVEVILPDPLPIFDPLDPLQGGTDSPPPLPDEEMAANAVAWLQVSRPKTAHINDVIRPVSWVGVNVVGVQQSRKATAELIGIGDGDSDQRYPLAQRPVLPETVELQVEEVDDWRTWQEVEPHIRGGPNDRFFTVDYTAGSVSFTGERVPQPGQQIRVLTYRHGGGAAGNVAAGAISALGGVSGIKDVSNPFAAAGGADAATLVDALDEVPATVHRRDRAVTADDFRDLAREVDAVARAETLPLLHPDTPDTVAAGVVSVVVFPEIDLATPNAPLPDFALLRRVARYLDARRLVTTELYVIPPTYRQVAISVGLAVRTGYQVDAVRQWVELIVRQYLAPLPPYGPDGQGWPLGRAVRRAELEAVAVQVEGVEFLRGLILAVPDNGGFTPSDLISLARWEVPELIDITVVSGDPLQPGEAYTPTPPTSTPVPLPPDVC